MKKNTFLLVLVLMAIPLTLNAQQLPTAQDNGADTSVLRTAVINLQADMDAARQAIRAGQNQCGQLTCTQVLVNVQQQLTALAQRPGAINYTSQIVALQQQITDLTGQLTALGKTMGKLPEDTATAVETKLNPEFKKLLEAIEAKPTVSQCNQLFEYLGADAMKAADAGDKAAIGAAYVICMQQPVKALAEKNVSILEKRGGMLIVDGNGLRLTVNSAWGNESHPWPYWMSAVIGPAAGGLAWGATWLANGSNQAQAYVAIPTAVLSAATSIIISYATE